jgi:hypothetical protein
MEPRPSEHACSGTRLTASTLQRVVPQKLIEAGVQAAAGEDFVAARLAGLVEQGGGDVRAECHDGNLPVRLELVHQRRQAGHSRLQIDQHQPQAGGVDRQRPSRIDSWASDERSQSPAPTITGSGNHGFGQLRDEAVTGSGSHTLTRSQVQDKSYRMCPATGDTASECAGEVSRGVVPGVSLAGCPVEPAPEFVGEVNTADDRGIVEAVDQLRNRCR